jgi:hypothetical protein
MRWSFDGLSDFGRWDILLLFNAIAGFWFFGTLMGKMMNEIDVVIRDILVL